LQGGKSKEAELAEETPPPFPYDLWNTLESEEYTLLQGGGKSKEAELASEPYRAAVPLLPARTDASMKEYWRFYLTSVSVIILFGGLLSPVLEFKMGLGGMASF